MLFHIGYTHTNKYTDLYGVLNMKLNNNNKTKKTR